MSGQELLLEIEGLCANVGDTPILKGIDLKVGRGEIHAIMGPNGSGKSTLGNVLAGRDSYRVTAGRVRYQGKDLLQMPADVRAKEGIFLGFQYPVEIPGVTMVNFLKAAINAQREYRGQEPIKASEFLQLMRAKQELVELGTNLTGRPVNVGFSGGEKKRNEIFQMAMLEPTLAILDETDSGLDIDALRIVAHGVNKLYNENMSVILITHYQRLLDYIVPDFVHVLSGGRIIKSGPKELALELEEKGYDWLLNDKE